ncbi:hypothetical protein DICSQDRAFT_137897 [Dichomitus squalens LYAD-421 SS1]|uniref:Uncharacterized protein n=2 Tax=Dichomitus squalens TaxID=114155 RepID=A0A4Q9MS95_9APHY|nr:uncharacterized protein DICSQDRAFT_137897 [Dichomitus squalens LYAD-421 SS1]EJF60039.1 hypothetical protein DICSQDRAFT_137897 [Dichomitus squalens LYAD-421 SS1]TBU29171.1 hypothetical protein BD311DRAFT_661712 [Dichomitus squalens]
MRASALSLRLSRIPDLLPQVALDTATPPSRLPLSAHARVPSVDMRTASPRLLHVAMAKGGQGTQRTISPLQCTPGIRSRHRLHALLPSRAQRRP